MSLQTNILKEYRNLFPTETLREISQRSGIQLTRIFRLLNGSSMKLSEYEVFHEIIEKEQMRGENSTPIKVLREKGHLLSNQEIKKIYDFIQRKIQFNELVTKENTFFTTKQELAQL